MMREILFPGKFTGYHMLGVMGLFFGTIITVNLTLAFFAAGSWSGLIVKNTYVESQIFDQKKLERQRQIDLDWQYVARHSNGVFSIDLNDADGRAIEVDHINAHFARPTHEADDQMLILEPRKDGSYGSEIELAKGVWQVDIIAFKDNEIIWSQPIRILGE